MTPARPGCRTPSISLSPRGQSDDVRIASFCPVTGEIHDDRHINCQGIFDGSDGTRALEVYYDQTDRGEVWGAGRELDRMKKSKDETAGIELGSPRVFEPRDTIPANISGPRPLTAHPPRSRSLRRRSANRTDTGRSA